MDLSASGWQPLMLADGRVLKPQGLRKTQTGAAWAWQEEAGLTAGVTDAMLVLRHPDRDPTAIDVALVLAALGVDPLSVSPGPASPHPHVCVVLLPK